MLKKPKPKNSYTKIIVLAKDLKKIKQLEIKLASAYITHDKRICRFCHVF
jgi:hypothetical protein